MKVIRITEGFMVELPTGQYLSDMHGENLWETRSEAEAEIALALEWWTNKESFKQGEKS